MEFIAFGYWACMAVWLVTAPVWARVRRDGVSGEFAAPLQVVTSVVALGLAVSASAVRHWSDLAQHWPDAVQAVLWGAAVGAVLGFSWAWLVRTAARLYAGLKLSPFRALMGVMIGGCLILLATIVWLLLPR
jgi:hypothetical protein